MAPVPGRPGTVKAWTELHGCAARRRAAAPWRPAHRIGGQTAGASSARWRCRKGRHIWISASAGLRSPGGRQGSRLVDRKPMPVQPGGPEHPVQERRCLSRRTAARPVLGGAGHVSHQDHAGCQVAVGEHEVGGCGPQRATVEARQRLPQRRRGLARQRQGLAPGQAHWSRRQGDWLRGTKGQRRPAQRRRQGRCGGRSGCSSSASSTPHSHWSRNHPRSSMAPFSDAAG